jgi:pimeloyl-ACP methyl ester carboxylesterase
MIAPFTSASDMAYRRVGWPLYLLLQHNYDNDKRLAELYARPADQRPKVIIAHGDADHVVPISMGRKLAEMFPDMVRFEDIHDADHVSVLDGIERTMHEGYSYAPGMVKLPAGFNSPTGS